MGSKAPIYRGMKRSCILFILMLLVMDKSFAFENIGENCSIKYLDSRHLDQDCQADEVIEVWCAEEEGGEEEIFSQCFAYYEINKETGLVSDSKVKCNHYSSL